jgi:proline racemase
MTAALGGDFYQIVDLNKNLDKIADGKRRSILVASMT